MQYEYCHWAHNGRLCEYEWKRSASAVKKQDCAGDLKSRVKFIGDYEKHECAIQLENVTKEDEGVWQCDIESYVWGGSKGSGNKAVSSMDVVINGNDSKLEYSDGRTSDLVRPSVRLRHFS